jgi:hypothetical protein
MNTRNCSAFLLAGLCGGAAYASPLLTASCGPLEGVKVVTQSGKVVTTPESHSGNPILFVDSESPNKLVTHWKSPVNSAGPVDSYEAVVIEFSSSRLRAVERDSNGAYLYTLFLDSGTLFYSHHRDVSLFDPGPSLLTFIGKCTVQVKK